MMQITRVDEYTRVLRAENDELRKALEIYRELLHDTADEIDGEGYSGWAHELRATIEAVAW